MVDDYCRSYTPLSNEHSGPSLGMFVNQLCFFIRLVHEITCTCTRLGVYDSIDIISSGCHTHFVHRFPNDVLTSSKQMSGLTEQLVYQRTCIATELVYTFHCMCVCDCSKKSGIIL